MATKEQQKYLNYAFYAAIAMSGTILLFSFWLGYTAGFWTKAELILFPILGFLVKRGNYKASAILLSLFVVDRIAFLVNRGPQLLTPTIGPIPSQLIVAVLQSWILWIYFHRAFQTLNNKERRSEKPDNFSNLSNFR